MPIDKCEFLIIDDDLDEVLLFQRAFSKYQEKVTIRFCNNASEAKEHLQKSLGSGSVNLLPSAILCDLKLGHESGLDFLRWLRAQEKLQMIPFTIMTGSPFPGWVNTAYAAGASCVISKPMAYRQLVELLSQFATFWCKIAELPSFQHTA